MTRQEKKNLKYLLSRLIIEESVQDEIIKAVEYKGDFKDVLEETGKEEHGMSAKPSKPYEYILVYDERTDSYRSTAWIGFGDYEDALRKSKCYNECTIYSLAWDDGKGQWLLVDGDMFIDHEYVGKSKYNYLHFDTLNGMIYHDVNA